MKNDELSVKDKKFVIDTGRGGVDHFYKRLQLDLNQYMYCTFDHLTKYFVCNINDFVWQGHPNLFFLSNHMSADFYKNAKSLDNIHKDSFFEAYVVCIHSCTLYDFRLSRNSSQLTTLHSITIFLLFYPSYIPLKW